MSANEKEICKNLATELFNLVPSSNDLDITDIIEGRSCILLLSTLSSNRGFELHRSSTCVRTFIHSHTHMNTFTGVLTELQENELSPTEIQPRVPSRRAAGRLFIVVGSVVFTFKRIPHYRSRRLHDLCSDQYSVVAMRCGSIILCIHTYQSLLFHTFISIINRESSLAIHEFS